MDLNSVDKPVPKPEEIQPSSKKNPFTQGLRRLLGKGGPSAQASNHKFDTEQAVTIYQEGKVPLTEVARIIREHGKTIAENLYKEYGTSFSGVYGPYTPFEDKENKIQTSVGVYGTGFPTRRTIDVYIVPPDTEDEGPALALRSKVAFYYYKNKTGEWQYNGASVHGEHGGWVDPYSSISTEKEDAKFLGGRFYQERVDMKDMERALGRYLMPDQPTQQRTTLLKIT